MNLWAIDCHVHFYDGYDIDLAVRSSWKNIQMPDGSKPSGQCWCLASPPGVDGLSSLEVMAHDQASSTRVIVSQDSNGNAYHLLESDAGPIVVVPGTQAISTEGLEVLSLGAELPDGGPDSLSVLVDRVKSSGGLPVLPWGVGKWLGRRGRLVARLAQNAMIDDLLLLADNANRPWWWPLPGLLKSALANGPGVVSGSDPLPIQGDEKRIASAGIYCAVECVENAWEEIRHALLNSREKSARMYGKPMSNAQFWHNQLLLRTRSGKS